MSSSSHVTDVIIKEALPVRVLGLRKVITDFRQQKELWDTISAFWGSLRDPIAPAGPKFAVHHSLGRNGEPIEVEVCIPLPENALLPSDLGPMSEHTLPLLPRAASAMLHGSCMNLPSLYTTVFAWLEQQGEQVGYPTREIYWTMDSEDPLGDAYRTELVVPVL